MILHEWRIHEVAYVECEERSFDYLYVTRILFSLLRRSIFFESLALLDTFTFHLSCFFFLGGTPETSVVQVVLALSHFRSIMGASVLNIGATLPPAVIVFSSGSIIGIVVEFDTTSIGSSPHGHAIGDSPKKARIVGWWE